MLLRCSRHFSGCRRRPGLGFLACNRISASPRALGTATPAQQASESADEAAAVPKEQRTKPPEAGSIVKLTCHSLSSSGAGVCRTGDGFVVFVPGAIPGEQLTAKVRQIGSSSAEGSKLGTDIPSPHRADPQCSHFASCGGCVYQNITYEAQLEGKHQRVLELMRRTGKVENIESIMEPPLGSIQPYRYRNKMTFTCSTSRNSLEKAKRAQLSVMPTVGLYAMDESQQLVDIGDCWLQDEASNSILAVVKAHLPSLQQKGTLVVEKVTIKRGSHPSNGGWEHMVVLHTWVRLRPHPPTPEEAAAPFQPLVDALATQVPTLAGVVDCRAVVGREKAFPVLQKLHGKNFLEHSVGGLRFRTSPLSFFQTNLAQAEVLVDKVHEAAELRKGDRLVDLYCGVGLLGVSLARRQLDAGSPVKLHGYDIYSKSIQDARTNAKRLGLPEKSCSFRSADLGQPKLGAPEMADVVIVDPARAGLGASTIEYLRRCNARTLVYVSCDAATQARDVALLTEPDNSRSYWLESVQVCDMFPQTAHVESIAVLRRDEPLPPYQPLNRQQKKKFKPQRLHKAEVPTADLPWTDTNEKF